MTNTTIITIITAIITIIAIKLISALVSAIKNRKPKKKLKHRRKGAKKTSAKVTDGKKAKLSRKAVSVKKKGIPENEAYVDASSIASKIDLDPDKYIQNLAEEALKHSKDIEEITAKNRREI